ncbi:TIGR00266 family protein [Massilia sp. SR12]
MTTFTVTGDIDPFLQVSMQRGERIFCESNAMVMMDSTLELKGKMRGGLGGALMRSLANGESFFQQNIEASGGDGNCLLSPNLPGAMRVLDVGESQYMISDGAFVAATDGIDLKVRTQNVGNALFGQSGGFFITESSGRGQLVVSGFGALHEVQVEPGKEVVIDNAHVVAWDSALRYDLAVATRSSGGLLGNLVNSVTSGEGMVLRFSGRGKVLICSRNREAFVAWMMSRQTS